MNQGLSKLSFNFMLLFCTLILFSQCGESADDTLKRLAETTKKTCPLIMDEYTSMIDSEVLPNKTLKFTYKIKGTSDQAPVDVVEAMKNQLIQRLKTRKEIDFYKSNRVRFDHVFLGVDNSVVMQVAIEPNDYK